MPDSRTSQHYLISGLPVDVVQAALAVLRQATYPTIFRRSKNLHGWSARSEIAIETAIRDSPACYFNTTLLHRYSSKTKKQQNIRHKTGTAPKEGLLAFLSVS